MTEHARRKTILVVDDSHLVLALASEALESAGYRVLTHDRPTGCVSRIILERPDLVLIDVNMPELSGDTIVGLPGSAHPESGSIILLHSTMNRAELERRTRACQAHGFVQKSSDLDDLVRAVDGWLKTRASDPASASLAPSVPSMPAASADALPRHSGVRSVRPTVLFVDDDMYVLSAYRRSFQTAPFVSEFALSAAQAMTRIQSTSPPDVLVCDVLMPNTNGGVLYSRALSVDLAWQHRTVFVTGALGLDRASLALSGFQGPILSKPFEVAQLRAAIRECLELSGNAPLRLATAR
jgi:DNA-binding NtrC family response regulator